MIGYLAAKLFVKAYTAPIWAIPYAIRKAKKAQRRKKRR